MTTALPPSVLHSSAPISPFIALSTIDAFLTTANDTAAFRPDSTLSERGPVSSSTSGNQNLILHHLNRIKLGLEGVRIGAAELEAEDAVAEAQADEERASKKRKRDENGALSKMPRAVIQQDVIPTVNATLEGDGEPILKTVVEEGGEWEEKDDYELAQEDEEVDIYVERDPAGNLEQPANAQEAEDMMEVAETQPGSEVPLPIQGSETKPALDKEERKRLKKLKQKSEKQKAEVEGRARSKKDKKKT
jgi:hypothetical protein